jgi:hypothetical protein
MSRIYFHTLEAEAEVLGSERFHLGSLIDDYTDQKLQTLQARYPERALAVVSPIAARRDPHLMNNPVAYRQFFTGPSGYGTPFLAWQEIPFPAWTTKMNTASRSGDEDLILAVRIYATCEAFGWVDGTDREWFAEKIHHALHSGSFRAGHGWEDVIELLASTDKGEMVMSYSVTGSFPDAVFAWPHLDWNHYATQDKAWSDWESLDSDAQWAVCMKRLRADGTSQISPDRWSNVYAGANIAVQDLMQDDWKIRLDMAMSEEFGKVDPWR